MSDEAVISRLDELTKIFADPSVASDRLVVSGWAKELKEAQLAANLHDHPALEKVWEKMELDIVSIGRILSESEECPNRIPLIRYRNLVRALLGHFRDASKKVQTITDRIDQEYAFQTAHGTE